MTPTNKGLYTFCINCKHRNKKSKYPCKYSHRKVRGDIKYERDFKICLLKEKMIVTLSRNYQ